MPNSAEYQRAWRAKNPEKLRAITERRKQKWASVPKAQRQAVYKEQYEKKKQSPQWVEQRRAARVRIGPERLKTAQLRGKYGISLDDYNRMLEAQGSACAICRQSPAKVALAVDHDHETGRVRGLLCGSCNQGLGRFNDSPEALRAAAEYLEKEPS